MRKHGQFLFAAALTPLLLGCGSLVLAQEVRGEAPRQVAALKALIGGARAMRDA